MSAPTLVISVNDVFTRGKERLRLLAFDTARKRVYYIPLDVKNPLPQFWSMTLFDHRDFRASLKVIGPLAVDRPENESAVDAAVADVRHGRIKGLIERFGFELLDKRTRNRHLIAYAEEQGSTDRTLLADLRLWWLGGQTKSALFGNFFRCGEIAQANAGTLVITKDGSDAVFAPVTVNSRGRRPADGSYKPFSFTADIRKVALKVGKTFYEKDESKSLRATCDHVARKLFALKDGDGTLLRDPTTGEILFYPDGQRASDRQIHYLLAKALNLTDSFKKRSGTSNFDNNHAPATGSVLDDCAGPGSVYEIDATFIDLWVVAKGDRKTLIGKCTAYLVVDRATKLIVGFHISLENPSWVEAQQAVLSIAGDWEALCKRLGVEYKASDWPARGVLPGRFVGDRGEMIAYKSNVLCDAIGIEVTNLPAKASQRKCIVECGFKTTQIPLADSAPGYEPPTNPFKRQAKKYDKDGCLDLDELAAIYLLAIKFHNTKVWEGLPMMPEQIYAGDRASSITQWNHGVEEHTGTQAKYAYDDLRKALMLKASATVKVDGIFYGGCAWEFDDPRCRDWLSRASLTKQFDVPIAYGPASVKEIYIFDPHDKRKHFIGKLTSEFKHLGSYSFAEAWALKRAKDKLDKRGAKSNQGLRAALAEDIEKISDAASAEMKAATVGVSHGSRRSAGPDARDAEARRRRESAHSLSGPQSTGVAPAAESDADEVPAATNVIRLGTARRSGAKPASGEPVPHSTPDSAESDQLRDESFNADPDVMSALLGLLGTTT